MPTRLVKDLRPNHYNHLVFSDSLTQEGVAWLAEAMASAGQQSAILITPEGVIVDGERRWLAARQLGWTEVSCQETGPITDAQIEEIVLQSCTAARRATVREQVKLYQACRDALKAAEGLVQGGKRGKSKGVKTGLKSSFGTTPTDPTNEVTCQDIYQKAASRAGFKSDKTARMAEAIFEKGSPELQELVNREDLTITEGYRKLPKQPRVCKESPQEAPQEPEAPETQEPLQEATQDPLEPRNPCQEIPMSPSLLANLLPGTLDGVTIGTRLVLQEVDGRPTWVQEPPPASTPVLDDIRALMGEGPDKPETTPEPMTAQQAIEVLRTLLVGRARLEGPKAVWQEAKGWFEAIRIELVALKAQE